MQKQRCWAEQATFAGAHPGIQRVNEELEQLKSEREELHEQKRRRESLKQRLKDIDHRTEDNKPRIADRGTRREEFPEEVTTLQQEAEQTEQDDHSEIIELH